MSHKSVLSKWGWWQSLSELSCGSSSSPCQQFSWIGFWNVSLMKWFYIMTHHLNRVPNGSDGVCLPQPNPLAHWFWQLNSCRKASKKAADSGMHRRPTMAFSQTRCQAQQQTIKKTANPNSHLLNHETSEHQLNIKKNINKPTFANCGVSPFPFESFKGRLEFPTESPLSDPFCGWATMNPGIAATRKGRRQPQLCIRSSHGGKAPPNMDHVLRNRKPHQPETSTTPTQRNPKPSHSQRKINPCLTNGTPPPALPVCPPRPAPQCHS